MRHLTLLLVITLLANPAQIILANNISITNVTLTGATPTHVFVAFDISWDNSWRLDVGPSNWDAAWVFVKFSAVGGGGPWGHATLSASGHTAPSGSTITPTADGKGIFLYRSANGSGSNNWTNVQLKWAFPFDGLTDVASTVVQVFGVEMVYVTQGAFAAGSGGTEGYAFTLTTINTADATTTPAGTGSLGGQAGGYPTGQPAPTQANWPNGYNAFYLMKYEASEGQWVAFFNTLNLAQMGGRDITNSSGKNSDGEVNRNRVSWTTGFAATTAPDRACNFTRWPGVVAYLDWAGLRPMTELEFEKACRGAGQGPVPNEYVWGLTGINISGGFVLANSGTPNEMISNLGTNISEGNGYYNSNANLDGPLRCGIIAASDTTHTRSLTGGGYYGAMELGGNLFEMVVRIDDTGNTYTGMHGDGYLANDGSANVSGWPVSAGFGTRGGAWLQGADNLRTSDRDFVVYLPAWLGLNPGGGIRGVRTAP